MRTAELTRLLAQWFPPDLAEPWDNVGFLLGDPERTVRKVMTCLTITPESSQEAITLQVDLIITHHPIFFKGIKRLTADGSQGFLYQLARAGIGVYSPHTSFDNATGGINDQLADHCKLRDTQPLRVSKPVLADGKVCPIAGAIGSGRVGVLAEPKSASAFAHHLQKQLRSARIEYSADPSQVVQKVAIACGAASEFLRDAAQAGADTLVTGEARFHDVLLARQLGINMVLTGHYSSERFALESLARRLTTALPDIEFFASQHESDPLNTT